MKITRSEIQGLEIAFVCRSRFLVDALTVVSSTRSLGNSAQLLSLPHKMYTKYARIQNPNKKWHNLDRWKPKEWLYSENRLNCAFHLLHCQQWIITPCHFIPSIIFILLFRYHGTLSSRHCPPFMLNPVSIW